ncbi:molybdopterin molybdotransferase MoeA [Alienimonas californiensis]|uniref:Molybdopterin molybdenumtransferase n=1 Tax=Alienimonas californiensis TaxID=2527989 RepID=A0A517P8J1_9PLAN|nr:gephyrin-like molybdotransferase Glp [Alienimonas californiensis]QDT15699.1 Molybdopterin molybdenumtransferase [Alienimonas californiensis]
MLSVADACAAILDALPPRPATAAPLAEALGLCLTEPARATVDSPPFDKAMMDGYAVRSADCGGPPVTLTVIEEVPAGAVPTRTVGPGQCVKIMTGAPLPDGADAVIPVELSRRDGDRVTLSPPAPPQPGAAVMARGAAVEVGAELVAAGVPLTPAAIGLLAEHGYDPVPVVPRLRVAVLSTGDEVVPASQTPGPGQIRDANGPLLAAALAAAGATPVPLGLVGDDRAALTAKVREGLAADVLLLSGGVSMGDYDLVPGVLADCGVRQVFHKVNVKPGKPLWFGVHDGDGRPTAVFGLPGNPVSSLTGFELFVRPALRRLAGRSSRTPRRLRARLTEAVANRGDRPLYRPVRLTPTPEGLAAEPVRWAGSGDLHGAAGANGAALIPGASHLAAGETVKAFRWAGCE